MLLSSLALALTLGLPAQDAKPAAALDLLRAVPKDAWLFAQLRDLDPLRADLEKNAFWQLYQDQESSALRAWFEQQLAGGASADEPENPGKMALEFLGSVHGSMLLYLAAPPKGSEPDVVVIVDPGSPRGAFEKVYDQLVERLSKESITSTKSYAGVELRVCEEKPGAAATDKPAKASTLHHSVFLDSGTFAAFTLSSGPDRALELAHATIDRLRGTDAAEGLATSPRYLEAKSSVGARGRLELYGDLSLLLPAALADMPPRDPGEEKILAALGFTDLRWGYLTGDVGAGELVRLEIALSLPEKGMLRDLAGLLGKLPLEAARAFPKESQGVTLFSIDVPGLWKWIWDLAKVANPERSDASRAQIQAMGQGLGGIDIEKDIVGQLTGEFGANTIEVPGEEWLAASGLGEDGEELDKETPKGANFGQAWWIGLRDAKAFSATFENILDATGAGEQFETEEFQGLTIWTLKAPGASLSLAFTGKGAIYSNYPTALRSVLRMEGKDAKESALERESFKPLFAENGEAGMFSAMHTADSFKAALLALNLVARTLPPMGAVATPDGADNPLRHLPSPEAIDRHFQGTSTSALRRHGNVLGLRFSTR